MVNVIVDSPGHHLTEDMDKTVYGSTKVEEPRLPIAPKKPLDDGIRRPQKVEISKDRGINRFLTWLNIFLK